MTGVAQNDVLAALQKARPAALRQRQMTRALSDSLAQVAQETQKSLEVKLAHINTLAGHGLYVPLKERVDIGRKLPKVRGEVWKAAPPSARRSPALAPRRHASGKAKLGIYAARDSSYYEGLLGASMTLIQDSTGQYYMTHVYSWDDSLKVNFNEASGTVTIPPQLILAEGSTKVYFYSADWNKHQYNPQANITGTVDANGVIRIGSWGLFVPQSDGTAGIYNGFTSSTWKPSYLNTSYRPIKSKGLGDSVKYATLVEQTGPKEVVIMNFADNSKSVYARITSDKRLLVSPQVLMTNAFYGKFCCYVLDSLGKKIAPNDYIVGKYADDGTITFGKWAVVDQASHMRTALKVAEYTLHTDAVINWPQAVQANFEGKGTQAEPYLIKTATDIEALSASVESGNSYEGKYLKLAADISLAGMQNYVPIGNQQAPFKGNFDGDGKTLTGLSIVNRGSNYYGLFGSIGEGAIVKNLTLKDFTVKGSGNYVGTLAGENYGTLDHITISGANITVTGAYAGGIAGMTYGPTSNSAVDGTVSAYGSVGGLFGYSFASISNSHMTGLVKMPGVVSSNNNDAGGLASIISMRNEVRSKVTNCYFSGFLLDDTGISNTGGLSAITNGVDYDKCFNVGFISTSRSTGSNERNTGGLCGSTMNSLFNDCYNAGTIVKSGTSDNVGGLAGYLGMVYSSVDGPVDLSHFTNCYNSGTIYSTPTAENNHRGIWGAEGVINGYHPHEHYFTNCYNDQVATALKDSVFGTSTAVLVSGTLPEGFSSEVWQAKKGSYPVLKATASTTAALVSAANIVFQSNETPNKFKHTAAIHHDASLKAMILDGDNGYVTEDANMKVSSDSLYAKSNYATEMLVIGQLDQTQARIYRIAVVPQVFEGEGTLASPYLIRNKEDFKKLNEAVYKYSQPHEGDYFLMTNDIDFARANDFHGVGYGKNARTTLKEFGGDFNGGGHHIKGLFVKSYALDDKGKLVNDSTYNYGALFRIVGKYGAIHDLVIDKDNDFYIYSRGGAVAGYLMGKMYNVKNYADINGYDEVLGGLTGTVDKTGCISNCYNAGQVRGMSNAGGLTGTSLGLIEKSQNDGDVIGARYAYGKDTNFFRQIGGIAGTNEGTISDCVNSATITGGEKVGGIAGYAFSGSFYRNLNTGIVRTSTETPNEGGLVGQETTTGCNYGGNAYDASINIKGSVMGATKEGCEALSTTALVSGTLPNGLADSLFNVEAGAYPVLKAYANETATLAMRHMFAKFADGVERSDIQKPVELSQAEGLSWSLTTGKNYSIADNKLSLTSISDDAMAADTLTATLGKTFKKVLYIGSIPKILPGEGSKDDPFQVKTKDDLNKLANFIDKTGAAFKGYYFKVMNDIDYGGDSLHIVAKGGNSFMADFDGNGKTIGGYVYKNTTWNGGRYLGFFGTIGSLGCVHDLTLNGNLDIAAYGGCFVGKLYGTVRNVVNKGTITTDNSSAYVAGIAGDVFEGGLIDHARNEAALKFTGTYGAGIAARTYKGSVVKNCINAGALTSSKSNLAGIVSYVYTGVTVDSCANTGTLTSTSGTVNGIVGTVNVAPYSITNCYNTADITGTSYVAGIIGYAKAKSEGLIKNCYNTGAMTAEQRVAGIAAEIDAGTTISYCHNTGTITATDGGHAAGVIAEFDAGYGSTATNFTTQADHLYNTGDISTTEDDCGGVFGEISGDEGKPYITDSYNLGTVVSTYASSSVADVAGFAGSTDGTIERCWNAGDVSVEGFGAGGFASIGAPMVSDCFNVGNVEANGSEKTSETLGTAGGFWCYGRATIYNCYNMGNVTAPSVVGGIMASAFDDAAFVSTYNAGKITATGDDESTVSNISWAEDTELDSVAANYFDKTVNKVYGNDVYLHASGLSTSDMYDAVGLGDHYAYNRAAYPVLKNIEEKAVMNFFAADTLFQAGDDANHVTRKFYVGNLEGVEWTSSPNIVITDGVANCMPGKGWVKKTVNFKGFTFEKRYEVNVATATGINDVEAADASQLDPTKPMYNVAGQQVDRNYHGVVIQRGKKFMLK